jgi:glycosyltransferase involved in cell wall biosynthesis
MKSKLTVVIPAYNEENAIEETIKEVFKTNPECKIIVVDDCSKDSTFSILKKIKNENFKVIRHTQNKGYGGALITGFLAAKTPYVAFLDADLTYPPNYIHEMLNKIEKQNLDVAWGNRFAGKNESPLIRKIGNAMLSFFFLLIVQRFVPDVACGERVFRKDALMKIDPKTLPKGLDMITAMTTRIVRRKLKYALFPIDHRKREGASKLKIVSDFIKMVKNMIVEH